MIKRIKAVQTSEDNHDVVRKKDKQKEPGPWQIYLGKVIQLKNVYGKMKMILLWIFL